MDTSTTGNIYGIYGMSGSSWEYVMGVYTDGTKLWSGETMTSNKHSGFNGCLGSSCSSTLETGVAYPSDNKYYNVYTTSSEYTNAGLQHAMAETKKWYGNLSSFGFATTPWLARGGYWSNGGAQSIFGYYGFHGGVREYFASRSVLVK